MAQDREQYQDLQKSERIQDLNNATLAKAADERLNKLNFQMAKLKVWHGYGNCRTHIGLEISKVGASTWPKSNYTRSL